MESTRYIKYIFIIFLAILFTKESYPKISDANEVRSYYEVAPIMPGSAKYFIRLETIEKGAKQTNSHPIRIDGQVLRGMLKQLSYKYDREHAAIPLFSTQELSLLSEHVPKALSDARPNEEVTFVVKGVHASMRWKGREDRLTAGRIFVANNQLNIIIGSVQLSLQPDLAERYMGNVWETAKIDYDVGHRSKVYDYEGIILVYKKDSGIYRKSAERKDWFVFTNVAYKRAQQKEGSPKNNNSISKDEYQSLQQQIENLKRNVEKQRYQKPQEKRMIKKQPKQNYRQAPPVNKKQPAKENSQVVVEQKLKILENLFKKGLISESEYQKKRSAVLNNL